MSYTYNLISWGVTAGVNAFVPFGSSIPGFSGAQEAGPSKKELQNRLNVARSMQKAVNAGKLQSVSLDTTQKMEKNIRSKQSEKSFASKTNAIKEMDKLGMIVTTCFPETETAVTVIGYTAKVANLLQYQSSEGVDKKDVVVKAAGLLGTVGLSTGATSLLPYFEALFTPGAIAGAATAVIGGAFVADNYGFIGG